MFTLVVMAEGSGSHMWPLSSSSLPKQFLTLDNHDSLSMLQSTLARIGEMSASESIIISNEEHRFVAAEQLSLFGEKAKNIIEPAGRNTALAIVLSAMHAISHNDDPVMLVLAADNIVRDVNAFQDSIRKAQ